MFTQASPLWLVLACALLEWRGVAAWGKDGHQHIAEWVKALATQKQEKEFDAMLNGKLMDMAGWEQNMTSKYPQTDALHWHRQDPEWSCGIWGTDPTKTAHLGDESNHVKCDGHGAERSSLFCALAWFFEHFASDSLLSKFPDPKEPIGTPKTLPALDGLTSVEKTPSRYLRWLVTLVGDLHQPLHWLREKDYGREVKVSYNGEEHTLLSFWEDYLPKNLPPSNLREKEEKKHYKKLVKAWEHKFPTELFREWAKEMGKVVCKEVYERVKASGANQTAVFALDEATVNNWHSLVQDFTTLGGQRLYFVLHELLEHKKHKAARKEGRGRHHRKENWLKNLGVNFLIGMVMVPLLLTAFAWHERAGGPGLGFLASKHLKM